MKKKKVLSLLLSIVLLFNISPVGALAESAPEPPTDVSAPLYDLLISTNTAGELRDVLNTADANALLSLTCTEVDAIEAKAKSLHEAAPDDTAMRSIADTLNAIRAINGWSVCSCGSNTETHAPECPKFVATDEVGGYSSGYETTDDGYVIYYANATNAQMFGGNSYTSVSYNSTTDTIQLKGIADQSDPNVKFDIQSANLDADAYPYVVVTYRSSRGNETTELFELTSTQTGAVAGQSETFGVLADGRFHSMILHPGQDNAWDGTIHGFRFDYYGHVSLGDLYEIDSIAFCETEEDAKYVQWERESVLNNHGVFEAGEEMLRLFSGFHNVTASYNAAEGAIVLTVSNTHQNSGHVTVGMNCNAFGDAAAFDPICQFNLPGKIDDSYKYMVMTYKTPSDPRSIVFDCSSQYPDKYVPYNGSYIGTEVFPQSTSGKVDQKYSRIFETYEKEIWYSDYIYMEDDLEPSTLNYVRIDPFACHYAVTGMELHIKSIIFCKTLDQAQDKIEEEIKGNYPYDYELVYNDNVTDGSVSNMPDVQFDIYCDKETFTYTISSTIPVRPNYTFLGWSLTADGKELLTGNTLSVNGVPQQVKTTVLYAIWEEKQTVIQYTIVGPDDCGVLTPPYEMLNVVTGNATGTIVTANTGFKIVGWYMDAACTIPAPPDFSTYSGNGTYNTQSIFKPTKAVGSVWYSTIYYVKIAYAVADLTIYTSGLDSNYSYIFTIIGTPSDTSISPINMEIAINGNSSKTIKGLPVGTYTVTAQNGWSWRYIVSSQQCTVIVDGGEHAVIFNATTTVKNKWLDGCDFGEFFGNIVSYIFG